MLLFFFFKQKTADVLRISDFSSDVCSSDLSGQLPDRARGSGPVVSADFAPDLCQPARDKPRSVGPARPQGKPGHPARLRRAAGPPFAEQGTRAEVRVAPPARAQLSGRPDLDWKSSVPGKRMAVRVELCGARIIKK